MAKTFLMSDCVVVEIKEPEPAMPVNPMDNSGTIPLLSSIISLLHVVYNFTHNILNHVIRVRLLEATQTIRRVGQRIEAD